MKNILLLSLISSTVSLAADYTNGEVLYFQKGCTSCHGPQAQGMHAFPALANKKAYKLRNKLLAYRADQVKTPQASVMTGYAKNLKPDEMEDIIEYLSKYKKVDPKESYNDAFEEWGDGGS